MPPLLDVSDVLTDIDFIDQLTCIRNTETVNQQGQTVLTPALTPSQATFYGVVTSDEGSILERLAVGERAAGTILVVTKFQLIDSGPGHTADIVVWDNKQYTVKRINDYSRYGQGFVEAVCEIVPIVG